MYEYVYVYYLDGHTHTHARTNALTRTYMNIHTYHIDTHTNTYTLAHTNTHIHTHSILHILFSSSICDTPSKEFLISGCENIYIYIYIYTNTNTHTHIHTHTRLELCLCISQSLCVSVWLCRLCPHTVWGLCHTGLACVLTQCDTDRISWKSSPVSSHSVTQASHLCAVWGHRPHTAHIKTHVNELHLPITRGPHTAHNPGIPCLYIRTCRVEGLGFRVRFRLKSPYMQGLFSRKTGLLKRDPACTYISICRVSFQERLGSFKRISFEKTHHCGAL